MTRKIKIGDWVVIHGVVEEVEVTGVDRGTDELIIRYVLANGRDAFKTINRKQATLYMGG